MMILRNHTYFHTINCVAIWKIFLFPFIYNRYGNAHLKHFVKFVLYGYVCVLLYAFVYNSRSTGRENKIRFKGAANRLYFYIMHVALSRFYDRLRCNLLYTIKVMVQSCSNFIFTIMHTILNEEIFKKFLSCKRLYLIRKFFFETFCMKNSFY